MRLGGLWISDAWRVVAYESAVAAALNLPEGYASWRVGGIWQGAVLMRNAGTGKIIDLLGQSGHLMGSIPESRKSAHSAFELRFVIVY